MHGRVGQRLTRQRAAVAEVLSRCADFVSAQQLHARLLATGPPVGLSTVYRTLRELERAGRLDAVRDTDGGRRYRPRVADEHRHYLICRACGRSQAIDTEVIERWADGVGESTGFTEVEHTLELHGVCAHCRPAPREAVRHPGRRARRGSPA
ncbi:Fur family transcriptional regulator [Streptomyces sp. O3]